MTRRFLGAGPVAHGIPVVGASFADGAALAAGRLDGVRRGAGSETRTDYSVIAEKEGVRDDNVVMAGAHLDSVQAGPGINDNGSGSAALLEVAQNLANHRPRTHCGSRGGPTRRRIGRIRPITSTGLSPAELDRIALYLNFDMVGSPNYFFERL